MAFAETEREWAKRVARHLKVELKSADVTYEELAQRLKGYGFDETTASITNKLSRATLSAHFFLASLAAISQYSATAVFGPAGTESSTTTDLIERLAALANQAKQDCRKLDCRLSAQKTCFDSRL